MGVITRSIKAKLPTMVQNEVVRLPDEMQKEFVEEFNRKAKSTGVGYLFYFLFGFHYAYLGQWGAQLLYWLTGGGFLIWLIIDLFRIPSIIRNYNKDVATKILINLKVISGSPSNHASTDAHTTGTLKTPAQSVESIQEEYEKPSESIPESKPPDPIDLQDIANKTVIEEKKEGGASYEITNIKNDDGKRSRNIALVVGAIFVLLVGIGLGYLINHKFSNKLGQNSDKLVYQWPSAQRTIILRDLNNADLAGLSAWKIRLLYLEPYALWGADMNIFAPYAQRYFSEHSSEFNYSLNSQFREDMISAQARKNMQFIEAYLNDPSHGIYIPEMSRRQFTPDELANKNWCEIYPLFLEILARWGNDLKSAEWDNYFRNRMPELRYEINPYWDDDLGWYSQIEKANHKLVRQIQKEAFENPPDGRTDGYNSILTQISCNDINADSIPDDFAMLGRHGIKPSWQLTLAISELEAACGFKPLTFKDAWVKRYLQSAGLDPDYPRCNCDKNVISKLKDIRKDARSAVMCIE